MPTMNFIRAPVDWLLFFFHPACVWYTYPRNIYRSAVQCSHSWYIWTFRVAVRIRMNLYIANWNNIFEPSSSSSHRAPFICSCLQRLPSHALYFIADNYSCYRMWHSKQRENKQFAFVSRVKLVALVSVTIWTNGLFLLFQFFAVRVCVVQFG